MTGALWGKWLSCLLVSSHLTPSELIYLRSEVNFSKISSYFFFFLNYIFVRRNFVVIPKASCLASYQSSKYTGTCHCVI